MITHKQWVNKYLHIVIDVDKAYGGQCVDVARSHMSEVDGYDDIEGVHGAVDFFVKYDDMPKLKAAYFRIVYQLGMIPPDGAKVVWGTTPNNPFGHIAVSDESGQIRMGVMEQDGFDNPARDVSKGTSKGLVKRETGYGNVLGWLVPREKPIEIKVSGNVPPAGSTIAESDRTAQIGFYWLNKTSDPKNPRWMLLTAAGWKFI